MTFNTLMLHNVKSIEVSEEKTLSTGVKYKDFTFKTDDGEFTVTSFFDSEYLTNE